MNIQQQLDDILSQILNGHLTEAEKALDALAPETAADRRVYMHHRGILEFNRGQFTKARDLMQQALDEFGDHVDLLRDLIVLHYQLGDMIAFRAGLQRFEVLLLTQEATLPQRALLEGELMLGKFLEEEARLAPAVLFYDKALARARTPIERFRVLIQKARWQALYEPGPELSAYYRELISFPDDHVTRDQWIELQHALVMIELRLVGSDHARLRLERLGDDISSLDRRLLVFDFVEGALSLDLALPPSILTLVGELQDLTPYEVFLRKLVLRPPDPAERVHDLAALASKLPWSSYLRLLCLAANSETQGPFRVEWNRKIQLIIHGLDARSQALWNQRLKQALQTPEIRMDLSMRGRSVTVQGKRVDLSKKKIGLQLLAGLRDQKALSVDQAISMLWQTGFSPEYYHRLRMSTHRLNTLIHEVTGLGKLIEVDSQTVRLRPEVKLKCADDGFETELFTV